MTEKDELIEAQDRYIELLSKEIDRTAVYLKLRDMGAPQETITEGFKLRNEIDRLKKLLNGKQTH